MSRAGASERFEAMMSSAIRDANEMRYEHLTIETVLHAMVASDPAIQEVFRLCGAEPGEVWNELDAYVKDPSNFVVLDDRQAEDLGRRHFADDATRKAAAESGIRFQPQFSLALQRSLQRAHLQAAQGGGRRDIESIHLLLSVFQERGSFGVHVLRKHGIDRRRIMEAVERAAEKLGPSPSAEPDEDDDAREDARGETLEAFTHNLVERAKEGRIDPLVGRGAETARIMQVLCRRRKNNPLLVGDPGVGKTAIVEGLALKIARGEAPAPLADADILSLDMASLVAGTKYRGDFEQRMTSLLAGLERRHEEGRTTLVFIDEIHVVMGAGAAGGALDAAGLLRTSLLSGRIKCIGSTTHKEYRQFVEKDPAFERRFQKIDVQEPSAEEAHGILMGLRSRFEKFHGVKYPPSVLRLAVELARRHIPGRNDPDRSIDVIDEAGAALRLRTEGGRRGAVTKRDVEETVARLSNIPGLNPARENRDGLRDLGRNLKGLIFGQDQAIDKVADAVVLAGAGLGEDARPMACFLFAGPTGVGKTELARQIALGLGIHLTRLDMSEYMESHAVARLIGAPPGYVGHEQGGLLTDEVRKHPHCLLLLDEIEKAHRDITNTLLQVMDSGTLTDSQGRSTDFKNTIIVMTTNQGSEEMEAGAIGLAAPGGEETSRRDQAIRRFFSPEFRNRLDAVVHFRPLDRDCVLRVVEKLLKGLAGKLAKKRVEMEVSPEARRWLAAKGYDRKMGARPLARMIDEKIKRPLSGEILFGRLERGGRVGIDVAHGRRDLAFTWQPRA